MLFRQTDDASKPPRNQRRESAGPPQKIVSLHFPKAAGTSLRAQFAALVGDRAHMDYSHDPLTPSGAGVSEFPQGKRLVHGHFHARRYASTDAYLFTFLREPVDNLISTYFYWRAFRRPGHELHARFLRDRPSLAEFATYPGIQRLMSETYFGDFDMARFDFIGFHETRDCDIQSLASALHLNLSASVQENKSRAAFGRIWARLDRNTINRVKHHLADDIDFYNLMAAVRGKTAANEPHGFSLPAATANV